MLKFLAAAILALVSLSATADTRGELKARLLAELSQHGEEFKAEVRRMSVEAPRVLSLARELGIPADVEVVVIKENPLGIGFYYPGIIVLDEFFVKSNADDVVLFVLAHEYGHHIARHWESSLDAYISMVGDTREKSALEIIEHGRDAVPAAHHHAHEFEADSLAVSLLSKKGHEIIKPAQRVLMLLTSPEESKTHPSGAERLKRMQALLK